MESRQSAPNDRRTRRAQLRAKVPWFGPRPHHPSLHGAASRFDPAGLLSRFDEYLDPKLRRLEALARQARSGSVLEPADTGWELTQTWGEDAAWLIDPDNPALHGPAYAALRPDPHEALPA